MKTITAKLVFKGEGETWELAAESAAKALDEFEKKSQAKAADLGIDREDFDAEDHPLNGKDHLDLSMVNGELVVTIG